VAARWFSNYERAMGRFPETALDHLHTPMTLSQGRFEVSEQFQYAWRLTETGSAGQYFGAFGSAFAIVAFVARDRKTLRPVEGVRVYSPSEIGEVLRTL
jgi:hypothetical protein